MARWKPLAKQGPGPKRDDPLRREALRLHALRDQEFKKRVEHEIKALQVKIGSKVRVKIEGRKTVRGMVVGETKVKKTECWIVQSTSKTRPYAKVHCEQLKAKEISKSIRELGKDDPATPQGPEIIYGNGDI